MKFLKPFTKLKPKVKMTLIIVVGVVIVTLIIAAAITGEMETLLGIVEKAKQ